MSFFSSIILFFAFSAFALPLYAADSAVTVSAQGVVSVKPDMAELRIQLIDKARTAEQSVAISAKKYKTVQQALRTINVSANDARTKSFSVRQEWEWNNSTQKRVFKGYVATHVLHVIVENLDDVGRVIDASVRAGANEIPVIRFTSSKYEEKRREALVEAVENAKKDAQTMAMASGLSLGKLLDMQHEFSPVYPLHGMAQGRAEKALSSTVPTEIFPSEQDINVSVHCRWSLVGK